jgi:hypothetical protein
MFHIIFTQGHTEDSEDNCEMVYVLSLRYTMHRPPYLVSFPYCLPSDLLSELGGETQVQGKCTASMHPGIEVRAVQSTPEAAQKLRRRLSNNKV